MDKPKRRGVWAVLYRLYRLSLVCLAGSMLMAGLHGIGATWVPSFPWVVSAMVAAVSGSVIYLVTLFAPIH